MTGGYFIGVDLGGTAVKCGLVDEYGNIRLKRTVDTDTSAGAKSVFDSIEAGAGPLIKKAAAKGWRVCAAGVGTPGAVDPRTGRIAGGAENIPGWKDAPLVPELKRRLKLPVYASNDVTLSALGEARFGAGKGRNNVFCFAIGTGIGGGAVIGGKIYRGAGDAAAEVGHMTVKLDGRRCNCGGRGCLEIYASASAIAREGRRVCRGERYSMMLRLAGGNVGAVSAKNVFDAAKKGDASAMEIVKKTGHYLGAGIANVINLFNPEVVIIGGGVSRAGSLLVSSARESLRLQALDINIKDAEIVLSKLHLSAGLLGAAALCLQELKGC